MASSPRLSGQSIVPRLRSESGWKSCTGELAVLIFFSLFFFFFIDFFFRSFAAILYYARLKSSEEYLCIVLFSLYYISQGLPLLIGNFTLSKCTLKLRTCVGTLLNLSVIKLKKQSFFINANLEPKHLVFHTISVHLFLAARTPLVPYNL